MSLLPLPLRLPRRLRVDFGSAFVLMLVLLSATAQTCFGFWHPTMRTRRRADAAAIIHMTHVPAEVLEASIRELNDMNPDVDAKEAYELDFFSGMATESVTPFVKPAVLQGIVGAQEDEGDGEDASVDVLDDQGEAAYERVFFSGTDETVLSQKRFADVTTLSDCVTQVRSSFVTLFPSLQALDGAQGGLLDEDDVDLDLQDGNAYELDFFSAVATPKAPIPFDGVTSPSEVEEGEQVYDVDDEDEQGNEAYEIDFFSGSNLHSDVPKSPSSIKSAAFSCYPAIQEVLHATLQHVKYRSLEDADIDLDLQDAEAYELDFFSTDGESVPTGHDWNRAAGGAVHLTESLNQTSATIASFAGIPKMIGYEDDLQGDDAYELDFFSDDDHQTD